MGNTNRILPRGRSLRVRWESWERPPLFALIQRTAGVPEEDMRRTFNLGIGLVLVVPAAQADAVVSYLKRRKESPVAVGDVV